MVSGWRVSTHRGRLPPPTNHMVEKEKYHSPNLLTSSKNLAKSPNRHVPREIKAPDISARMRMAPAPLRLSAQSRPIIQSYVRSISILEFSPSSHGLQLSLFIASQCIKVAHIQISYHVSVVRFVRDLVGELSIAECACILRCHVQIGCCYLDKIGVGQQEGK